MNWPSRNPADRRLTVAFDELAVAAEFGGRLHHCAVLPGWTVTSSSCELSRRQPMALSAASAMRSELMGGSVSLEDLEELGYPGQGGASAPQSVSRSSPRTPST
jgi:hypothetical protein